MSYLSIKDFAHFCFTWWLRRCFLCLIPFVVHATSALAQESKYKFVRLDNNQGLSHNQVTSIYKDSKGFMWFGTMSGLNRYDGYSFKVFRHSLSDTTSINDNFINRITEDDENHLWIETRKGFNIFDPKKESFSRNLNPYLKKFGTNAAFFSNLVRDKHGNVWVINSKYGLYKRDKTSGKVIWITHKDYDSTSLRSNDISVITEDNNGNYWMINRQGILEKIDGKTYKVIYRNNSIKNLYPGELMNFDIFTDKDNDLWIFLPSDARGLFYFNNLKKTITHITKDAPRSWLNTNNVRNIVQEETGLLWIGTDHGGINLLNKKDFSVRYLTNDPDDEKSISQNSIVSMYKDNVGIIWIGTYKKGINYYQKNLIKFELIKHKTRGSSNSLTFDDVNTFVEDQKGNLWIGTNGGGLIYYDRKLNHFTSYTHQTGNTNSLSNDIIVSLYLDKQQKLWIGTYFGGLCVFDGKRFKAYRHNPSNTQSISDDRVWKVYEDSKNNLWIGTLGGCLDLFDRQKEVFYHYRNTEMNSVRSPYIVCFNEDSNGNLWIGTADGVDILQRSTGRFSHMANEINNSASLSNNNVTAILEDSRKWIWVTTREGLNLYNTGKGTFKIFREENGLPNNAIQSILEDNNHNIWVSTPDGLSCISISQEKGNYTFTFKNYDESDGLQGKYFNENSALKTKAGELIFGGVNGFNICQPAQIKTNKLAPNVSLTDFLIFNRSVKVNNQVDGRVVLENSINETKEITLKYNENIFSIEFAALNYIHPEKNHYKYMLEGFNNNWMKADGRIRKATYTNLNPGQYTFKVKASNNDDIWNEQSATLVIRVLPPFWRTKTAIIIYIAFIILALLLSRTILLERARLTFKLEQEKRESQQSHELDMMKIRFFTNISHEFRTPLSLIITPLEKIIKNTKDQDQKKHLELIFRNAKRLLNLVNQLLDFRRMEVQ